MDEATMLKQWASFWLAPWVQADSSWRVLLPIALAAADSGHFGRRYYRVLYQKLNIDFVEPPELNTTIFILASLPPEKKVRALQLASRIVYPQIPTEGLEDEEEVWCRRMAAGLRPGRWLEDETISNEFSPGLLLLRKWTGNHAGCWSRLRYLFNREEVYRCENTLDKVSSVDALSALWKIVVWRATHDI